MSNPLISFTNCLKRPKNLRLSPYDVRCIEQAMEYIDRHYAEKLSAEHLSIEVGLSKDKLQFGLQKRTGMTIHKYLQEVRMQKAKELLLLTNHPVKLIADAAGFINQSHFCRVFKKINAMSPASYRYQQAG